MVQFEKARPVSGEIMSAGNFADGTAGLRDITDASDAQFETLSRTEKALPVHPHTAATLSTGQNAGMNLLRQNSATTRHFSRKGGFLFWSIGLACVALAFWTSGGHALIMNHDILQPAPAGQALRIAAVESRVEARNGQEILFINGHAENHGSLALALPGIEIAVTGNDGDVTRYRLGKREPQLEPGGRHIFSSRLQAPDAGVRTVSVAFAEEGR